MLLASASIHLSGVVWSNHRLQILCWALLSSLNPVGDTYHILRRSVFLVTASSKNYTTKFLIFVPIRAIHCCLARRSFDIPLRRTDLWSSMYHAATAGEKMRFSASACSRYISGTPFLHDLSCQSSKQQSLLNKHFRQTHVSTSTSCRNLSRKNELNCFHDHLCLYLRT